MTSFRFVTYEHQDNNFEPAVLSEVEYYADETNSVGLLNDSEAFVWQYAESPDQALKQHMSKHDEWHDDQEAGRTEKQTY